MKLKKKITTPKKYFLRIFQIWGILCVHAPLFCGLIENVVRAADEKSRLWVWGARGREGDFHTQFYWELY